MVASTRSFSLSVNAPSKECSRPIADQLNFTVNGRSFAAQAWGDPSATPVLAIHGWLDNSASFYRLAPLLSEAYVVAIDTAGHGLSDYRGGGEPYNIWQDVDEIFAIADALGWQRFALLGHSRGAILSTLSAGTFPERITHLMLLDGFVPPPVEAGDAPKQLARSIADTRGLARAKVYRQLDRMIEARMRGFWPLSREAATALIERGVIEVEGGYCWRADPALHSASSLKLTAEHIKAFVDRISAPIELLLASSGLVERHTGQASALQGVEAKVIEGTHHFHMEEQASEIAGILNGFLAGQ